MAILDLKKKIEPYVKTATGYVKQMLSSKHVVMENGTDLETTVTELNRNMPIVIEATNMGVITGGYSYYYFIYKINNIKYCKIYGSWTGVLNTTTTVGALHYGTVENLRITPYNYDRINVIKTFSLRFSASQCSGVLTINDYYGLKINSFKDLTIDILKYYLTSPPRSAVISWEVVCEIE